MNKLTYISSVGLSAVLGFYAGQQHSAFGIAPQESLADKKSSLTMSSVEARRTSRSIGHNESLSTSMLAKAVPLGAPRLQPDELQSKATELRPLSPDEVAQQDGMDAEMIASMRENHLPEDHIAQMEKALGNKKQALQSQREAPTQRQDLIPLNSLDEVAKKQRKNMVKAGMPEEIIQAMENKVSSMSNRQDAQADNEPTAQDLQYKITPHPQPR